MQNSLYRDFYVTSLVPAGVTDQKNFLDIQPDLILTHLMIGLQGHQEEGKDFYHWNVTIYKSDQNGIYDGVNPVYASALYERFDDAVDAARRIEKDIRNDQLHLMHLQEKIS
ncbi:hypothetical protein [Mesobacillus jeotgali]|uniref:hypothetical protein n=1 Tax=Mesobacillus jeotgali TaxID=129985 RepID=UPI0009A7FBCF|nr:hypothetical protein [Mesobacillus jeotgali]